MWVTMPAFGAAAYVPSITLGECPLLGFKGTLNSTPLQACSIATKDQPALLPPRRLL
jgi:hypothetical protein